MAVFRHDNIDFYYEDDGGSGYPFVFLHGLGGDVNQPLGLIPKKEGIRRISIDFRGHGKTIEFGKEEDLLFDTFADDVTALIQYLELEKVNLGGISTGAGVALNMCLRYKEMVNSLILARPAWEDKPQDKIVRDAFEGIYKSLIDNSVEDAKQKYMKTEIFNEMNSLSKYAGDSLIGQFNYPYIKETAIKLVKIPGDAPNYNREEWRSIKIPALVLANKLDPIHPYEYGELLHSYIPDSKFIEVTSKTISNELNSLETKEGILDFLNLLV